MTWTLTDHTFGPLSCRSDVVYTQEEQHLWQEVESMKADHLKPDKYLKKDKDLMFKELKVRAQPLPLCGQMHGWGIASQRRGDHIWKSGESYLGAFWGFTQHCNCSSGSSW